MKFFIIHGAYGTPAENWFPWLKTELESLGHEVITPSFPTPENQTLDNWRGVFAEHLDSVDEQTVFVGHSLAPAFILDVLEQIDVQIRACFFVAGFSDLLDLDIDKINRTFVDRDFDWETIRKHCKSFHLYSSDDDPYVPLQRGEELASYLHTDVCLIPGAGHFNRDAGFTTFPQLLEDIRTILP